MATISQSALLFVMCIWMQTWIQLQIKGLNRCMHKDYLRLQIHAYWHEICIYCQRQSRKHKQI